MSRVLVGIYVPTVGREVDVYIPYEAPLHGTVDLLRAMLSDDEATGGRPVNNAVLCDHASGRTLDPNATPQELGIGNGARLMLI